MTTLSRILTLLILGAVISQYLVNKKLNERLQKMEDLTVFYETEIPKIIKTLDGNNNLYGTFLYGTKNKRFAQGLNYSKYFENKEEFASNFAKINKQALTITNHHRQLATSLTDVAGALEFEKAETDEARITFFNSLLNLVTVEEHEQHYSKQLNALKGYAAKTTESFNVIIASLTEIGKIIDVEISKSQLLDSEKRAYTSKKINERLALLKTRERDMKTISDEAFQGRDLAIDEVVSEIIVTNKELKKLRANADSLSSLRQTNDRQIILIKEYQQQLENFNLKIKKLEEVVIIKEQQKLKFKESLKRFTGDQTVPEIIVEVLQVDTNYGFILLNTGELGGIQVGMKVAVSRSGEYLTEATVYKTTDEHAFAKINLENLTYSNKPQAGDIAVSIPIKVASLPIK